MKRGLRITLTVALLAGVAVLLWALGRGTDHTRAMRTCNGVDIVILDSTSLGFVTKADIKGILEKEYGVYNGQPLDSVNLKKIENILQGRSAIRSAEAYTTGDGQLHILVTQREPAVRFQTGQGGYYADETGYIFPLQARYKSAVPVVKGEIPLNVPEGFKGYPATEAERRWLQEITGLLGRIGKDRKWHGAFTSIEVTANGELVLRPAKGKEVFYFGGPDNYADKLARLEKYYTHIVPSREPGYYKSVNVKYEKQIICRTH